MLERIRNSSQSLAVKIAFGIIIAVFVFWGIGSYESNPGVVAKVNGLPITEQDFVTVYNQQLEQVRAVYPEITPEELKQMQFPYSVLQNMVLQTLLVEEARRTGIEVSPRDILEVISTFGFALDANGKFDVNLYTQGLTNAGQDVANFEQMLRDDMLGAKFQEIFDASAALSEIQAKNMFDWQGETYSFDALYFADANYSEGIEPTEEELKAEYDKNIEEYKTPAEYKLNLLEVNPTTISATITIPDAELKAEYDNNPEKYLVAEQVNASHILLPVEENAPQAEVDAVLAQIAAIQERIAQGEDFGALAKELSADTFSAQSDGNLGFFTRGQMVKPFEDVAFTLEIGTISEPVRTRFGYHLIKVLERNEAHTPTFEEVKEDIHTNIALERSFPLMQSTLDNFLLAGTEGKNLTETAEKYGFKNVRDTGFLPLEALSFQYQIDDVSAVEQNGIGKIFSLPLATNTGIYLAEVTEIKEPSVQSFDSMKDSLVAIVKENKAHELANQTALEIASLIEQESFDFATLNTLNDMKINRSGQLSSLGENILLAEEIFATSIQDKWLPNTYEVDSGYILVKPLGKTAPNTALWEAQKSNIMQQLVLSRQQMINSIFIQELTKDAKIEIVNNSYFQ